jgi:hypothetical protein
MPLAARAGKETATSRNAMSIRMLTSLACFCREA